MRSKRKALFTKLNAGLAIWFMSEEQKDHGTRVVANINQAHAIIENHGQWHWHYLCTDLRKECQQLVEKSWHSRKDKNAVNERKPFPFVYKTYETQGRVMIFIKKWQTRTQNCVFFTLKKAVVVTENSVRKLVEIDHLILVCLSLTGIMNVNHCFLS